MNELIEIVEEANRYFVHYDNGSDSFYTQDRIQGQQKWKLRERKIRILQANH